MPRLPRFVACEDAGVDGVGACVAAANLVGRSAVLHGRLLALGRQVLLSFQTSVSNDRATEVR